MQDRTWEQKGNLKQATRVLERANPPAQSVRLQVGAFWLRNQIYLARLYKKQGRIFEARNIEADVRTRLAFGDFTISF